MNGTDTTKLSNMTYYNNTITCPLQFYTILLRCRFNSTLNVIDIFKLFQPWPGRATFSTPNNVISGSPEHFERNES